MNEAADSEKKMKQQNSLDLKAVEYIILKKKKQDIKSAATIRSSQRETQ